MRRIVLLFVVFATFFTVSCEKEGLTYTERRIVGTWRFDRVTEDGRNITNEYEQHYVVFNSDFSAVYENNQTGVTYTGVWDLVEDDDNGIFASFTEPVSDEVTQLVLNNALIYKQRISATFRDNFRNYRYRLRRQ